MDLQTIKNMVSSEEYNFLRNNDHLGDRIILIGLGGSHAYGTNNETSDLDVRGCALNNKEEILTNQHYEQFVDEKTDTTVYAFNKLISLLCNCNPKTLVQISKKDILNIRTTQSSCISTSRIGKIWIPKFIWMCI